MLPGETIAPAELRELSASYYEATIPPCILIHTAFIEAFVKHGKLVMLSTETPLDSGNVLAITPLG